jgi:predicted NBD/HSP70 family sugar kinase
MEKTLWGGIEAGGAKFICMVGDGPGRIKAETRFPTTTPEETIGRAMANFREQSQKAPLVALGAISQLRGFSVADPASFTRARIMVGNNANARRLIRSPGVLMVLN